MLKWWPHLVQPLLIVASCLISIFVILGNLLVVSAIWHENQLHSVTNYLIASLAAADCLVGALVMPFSIISEVIMSSWTFGATWCDLWHSFDVLASTASILNLCAISLDRYLAITDPISYPSKMTPNRVALLILSVWACSSLISFPAILWWRSVSPSPLELIIPNNFVMSNINDSQINMQANNNIQQQQQQQRKHKYQNTTNDNNIIHNEDLPNLSAGNESMTNHDETIKAFEVASSSNHSSTQPYYHQVPQQQFKINNKQTLDTQYQSNPHVISNNPYDQRIESSSPSPLHIAAITTTGTENSSKYQGAPSGIFNQKQQQLKQKQQNYQHLLDKNQAQLTLSNSIGDTFVSHNMNSISGTIVKGANIDGIANRGNGNDIQYRCIFTHDTSYLLFSSVISFYGPLVIMLYAYFRIYRAAVKQTRFLKHGTKQVSVNQHGNTGTHSYGRKSNVSNTIKGVSADQQLLVLRAHRGGGASTTTPASLNKAKCEPVHNNSGKHDESMLGLCPGRHSPAMPSTAEKPSYRQQFHHLLDNTSTGHTTHTNHRQPQHHHNDTTNEDVDGDKALEKVPKEVDNRATNTYNIEPCKPCQHHEYHRELDIHHRESSFNNRLNNGASGDINDDISPLYNKCDQKLHQTTVINNHAEPYKQETIDDIDESASKKIKVLERLHNASNDKLSHNTSKVNKLKRSNLVSYNDSRDGQCRNKSEESIVCNKIGQPSRSQEEHARDCFFYRVCKEIGDSNKVKRKQSTTAGKNKNKKRHSLTRIVSVERHDKIEGKSLKDYFYDDHKLLKPINNYDVTTDSTTLVAGTAHQRETENLDNQQHLAIIRNNVRKNKTSDCLELTMDDDQQTENVCHKSTNSYRSYTSSNLGERASSLSASSLSSINSNEPKRHFDTDNVIGCFSNNISELNQLQRSSSVHSNHYHYGSSCYVVDKCRIIKRKVEGDKNELDSQQIAALRPSSSMSFARRKRSSLLSAHKQDTCQHQQCSNINTNIVIPMATELIIEKQNKYDSTNSSDSSHNTRIKINQNECNNNIKTSVPNLYSVVVNHIVTSANRLRRSFSIGESTSSCRGDDCESRAAPPVGDKIAANKGFNVDSTDTKHTVQFEEVESCQNKHDVSDYTAPSSNTEKKSPYVPNVQRPYSMDLCEWSSQQDHKRKNYQKDCSMCHNKSSSISSSSATKASQATQETRATRTVSLMETQRKTKRLPLKLKSWVKIDPRKKRHHHDDNDDGEDDFMLKPPSSLLPLLMMNSDTSTISSNIGSIQCGTSSPNQYYGEDDDHHDVVGSTTKTESINPSKRSPKDGSAAVARKIISSRSVDTVNSSLKVLHKEDIILQMNTTSHTTNMSTDQKSTTARTICNRCCCCKCKICHNLTEQQQQQQQHLTDKSYDKSMPSHTVTRLGSSAGSVAQTSSGNDSNSSCVLAIDDELEFKVERESNEIVKSNSMNTSESLSFENETNKINMRIDTRRENSGSCSRLERKNANNYKLSSAQPSKLIAKITTKEELDKTNTSSQSERAITKKCQTQANVAITKSNITKSQNKALKSKTKKDIMPHNSSDSSLLKEGATSAVISVIDPLVTVVNEAAVQRQHRSVGRKLSKLAKERKAAKTLGIVMGVFIVCWLPFFVANIINALCGIDCIHGLMPIVTWLGWLNSAMNPVIYACWSRDFRRAFRKVLCSWVEFICPYGGSKVTKKLKLRKNNSHNSYQNWNSSSTNGGTNINSSKGALVSCSANQTFSGAHQTKFSFSNHNSKFQKRTNVNTNQQDYHYHRSNISRNIRDNNFNYCDNHHYQPSHHQRNCNKGHNSKGSNNTTTCNKNDNIAMLTNIIDSAYDVSSINSSSLITTTTTTAQQQNDFRSASILQTKDNNEKFASKLKKSENLDAVDKAPAKLDHDNNEDVRNTANSRLLDLTNKNGNR